MNDLEQHEPITAIDAHIHLDKYSADDQQRLLRESMQSGVQALVAVSTHLASSQATLALAETYPGRIMPAYGFHPEQVIPSSDEVEKLFQWIQDRHETPFAVGEVGLPYYTRQEAEASGKPFNLEPYIELLERFILLTKELDRPIVLHAVYEDADIACDLLERHHVRKAHFHWFKGAPHTIERMVKNGYFVSITPDVLYEEEIQQLVARYPLTQLMTETDGPWPFEGPFAGQQTHPRMVLDVVKAIADIKAIAAEQAAAVLYENSCRFYGINC